MNEKIDVFFHSLFIIKMTTSPNTNCVYMNTTPSVSPRRGTLLDVVRAEGDRLAHDHCGYRYLISNLGTIGDFQSGRIPHIRRKHRNGCEASYVQLRDMGKTDAEISKFFIKFFKRQHICSKGGDASDALVQNEWLRFRTGIGEKIKGPGRSGGKITYLQLVAEGKSHDDIRKIFNTRRRKYDDMVVGSYRYDMYTELQKMLAKFDIQLYNGGTRALDLSAHIEQYSNTPKPDQPTTFCQAVARMMTLVRLSHHENGANERNWKTQQIKEQKKVANDKRTTKYNALKTQMGVDAFNKKKARDQAAKEIKAAENISGAGKSARVAQFVKWRTETPEGKMFDKFPKKRDMSPYAPSVMWRQQFANTKHLGYTSHRTLAGVMRRCLDNPKMYSNIRIKFAPDPTDATSQLYQYAPISGQRPSMLRKTRDADTSRVFRVCGLLKCNRFASLPIDYYIQPDRPGIGTPMGGNVYYSLPTKWKDFEKWTGFGVVGNPQNSTYMPTLFKIVDTNISEVSFVAEGKGYKVGYTGGRATSFDKIFEGIRRVPTAAAAAAILAEKEKRRCAQESRAKEEERRLREAWKVARRKSIPKPCGRDTARAKLAEKLAHGDIDQATFNAAMDALK